MMQTLIFWLTGCNISLLRILQTAEKKFAVPFWHQANKIKALKAKSDGKQVYWSIT